MNHYTHDFIYFTVKYILDHHIIDAEKPLLAVKRFLRDDFGMYTTCIEHHEKTIKEAVRDNFKSNSDVLEDYDN